MYSSQAPLGEDWGGRRHNDIKHLKEDVVVEVIVVEVIVDKEAQA